MRGEYFSTQNSVRVSVPKRQGRLLRTMAIRLLLPLALLGLGLIIAPISAASAAGQTFELVVATAESAARGAACLDGSPVAYYVAPAPAGGANPNGP